MSEQSVIHDTFVIERSYPRSAARVFASDGPQMRRGGWEALFKNLGKELERE